MKPSPERLDPSSYPFTTAVEPRFGDMDALRHLNNVAIAGIYEEGRVRFTAQFRDKPVGATGDRAVLADVRIRYLAEGHYPGALTVGVGVGHVGTTSYTMVQALFQNGRCIGTCDVVAVYTSGGCPHPVPDSFRAALEAALMKTPAAVAS